jgi:hypothetical protein
MPPRISQHLIISPNNTDRSNGSNIVLLLSALTPITSLAIFDLFHVLIRG